MSIVNGFRVGSETLKYNYESLDNYNTPNFSTSSSITYAVGDYVMYNGKLYKCTTATTGGTWVSGNWTEAVLSDDVSDLSRQISEKQDAPGNAGTAGQVLGLDNQLNPVWLDQGTSNYSDLTNKPAINGHELTGNQTSKQLGLASETDIVKVKAYNRTNNNIVFFGDSWTVGTGIAMEDRPTKRFSAIISRKLEMTEFNYGVGGAGFVRSGNLFSTQIQTASDEMTQDQKDNTGVVVIVGGVNDYRHRSDDGTNTTAFVNGVVNTATLAHTTFPNALIVIGIGDTNKTYFPKFAKDWYRTAIITCEQSLQFPSIVIKNLYNVISGESGNYASDNLHPNEQGHARFGGYIANAILGGGQTVSRYLGNVSLVSPASIAEGGTMCIYRINDEIVIDQVGFKYSSAITSNTQIGSINAAFVPPANSYYPYYQGNVVAGCICVTASGSLRVIPNSGVSITAGFSQQIRYMFGKETNTDES